ncbi:MAG: hypothetical protein IJH39_06530 [Clostridia bacterium]|nr:hypothetical protein [Clostridia bacterium]
MKKGVLIGIIVVVIIAVVAAVFVIRGLGEGPKDNGGSSSEITVSESIKGKQNVFETIKLIETENTVEEINEIIGFEGECTDEENKTYKWEISQDTSVKVQYSKNNDATIEISFPSKKIANENVDFSKFEEIKSAMNTSSSITYDEIVQKLGGVEGTLKYKAKGTVRYEWDRPDGGYLTCTFNSSSMKCTFASGRF